MKYKIQILMHIQDVVAIQILIKYFCSLSASLSIYFSAANSLPILRQWYSEFILMCADLLFMKTPESSCLIGKTPGLNRTLVYNHIETHSKAISLLWIISIQHIGKHQGIVSDYNKEILDWSRPFSVATPSWYLGNIEKPLIQFVVFTPSASPYHRYTTLHSIVLDNHAGTGYLHTLAAILTYC